MRAPVEHPAGCDRPLPFLRGSATAVFRLHDTLDTRKLQNFVAGFAAHMLVYLRIYEQVSLNAARLTTDLSGWTLVGWVLHPLDDSSKFQ